MKKTIAISLFFLLMFAIISIITIIFFHNCDKSTSIVAIDLGDYADNEYNNLIAGGNLLRINDEVYYNYENGDKYSIIRFTRNTQETIFKDKSHINPHPSLYEPLRSYDGKVITYFYSDQNIKEYHKKNNEWKKCSALNSVPDISLDYYNYNGDYIYSISENDERTLIRFSKNEKTVICDSIQSFTVNDDNVYFCESDKNNQKCYLKNYNISNKETSVLCDFPYSNVTQMFAENRFVVICSDSIYKFDINSGNNSLKKIEIDGNDFNSCNVYNNKLYIAMSKGIYSYDLTTDSSEKIISDFAYECYIVDDEHIFFVDRINNLWSVSLSDRKVKKIYPSTPSRK